jgi:hypothetical protein
VVLIAKNDNEFCLVFDNESGARLPCPLSRILSEIS